MVHNDALASHICMEIISDIFYDDNHHVSMTFCWKTFAIKRVCHFVDVQFTLDRVSWAFGLRCQAMGDLTRLIINWIKLFSVNDPEMPSTPIFSSWLPHSFAEASPQVFGLMARHVTAASVHHLRITWFALITRSLRRPTRQRLVDVFSFPSVARS